MKIKWLIINRVELLWNNLWKSQYLACSSFQRCWFICHINIYLNLCQKKQEKHLLSLSGNSNTNTREYEAFVTILMQARPSTQKGCKRQLYNSEGDSEIEKWRKRWRRNAAMRKASVIFPKTWWILMAKITSQRIRDKDTIWKIKIENLKTMQPIGRVQIK